MRYRATINLQESYKVGERDNWGTLANVDVVVEGPAGLATDAISKFMMTAVMSINELGGSLNINPTQHETGREEEQSGADQGPGGSDPRTAGGEGVPAEERTEQSDEDILGD